MRHFCKDCGWAWINKQAKDKHGHVTLEGGTKSEVELLKEENIKLRQVIKIQKGAFSLLKDSNKILREILDEQV